jgi:WD40 repeat protein
MHSSPVKGIDFSPDGTAAISHDLDGVLTFWDPRTGRPRAHSGPIGEVDPDGGVFSRAFSADSAVFAAGYEDGAVRLWDVRTGRALRRLIGHADRVYALAFSPDGTTLATGGIDGTARLWDIRTGRQRTIVTTSPFPIDTVAISPDGSILATAGAAVRLWNARTGAPLTELTTWGNDEVSALAFSTNSDLVVTGTGDGATQLWKVAATPAEAIRAACLAAGRDLTRQEWADYLPGSAAVPVCPRN